MRTAYQQGFEKGVDKREVRRFTLLNPFPPIAPLSHSQGLAIKPEPLAGRGEKWKAGIRTISTPISQLGVVGLYTPIIVGMSIV